MVSVEHYPCFCTDNGLKQFTSKAGTTFVKCGTEQCSLFCPSEKYNELYSVYENKVAQSYKRNNFPVCECNEIVSLWVSHSTANPLRPFFRCKQVDDDTKCSYFKWADIEMPRKIKRKRSSKNKEKKKTFKKVIVRIVGRRRTTWTVKNFITIIHRKTFNIITHQNNVLAF